MARVLAIALASLPCLAGIWFIYAQALLNHQMSLLEKFGQRTTGMLQNVIVHKVNGQVSSYTFDIRYAGGPKSFEADKSLFDQNTSADGKFVKHPIDVIFLPDKPKVAALPGMTNPSVKGFVAGGILLFFGGPYLLRAFARRNTLRS